jgi:hypothetical protein
VEPDSEDVHVIDILGLFPIGNPNETETDKLDFPSSWLPSFF